MYSVVQNYSMYRKEMVISMSKTTLEQLAKINQRFESAHGKCNETDLYMANSYIELIEKSRNNNLPMVGDIVQYTNAYGDYYNHAIVEYVDGDTVGLCERGNPSIHRSENKIGFGISISGGSFPSVSLSNMKLIGTTETNFWDFGHRGACADGGIDFCATVNLWECNVNEQKYSTKEREKYYISWCSGSHPSGYHYFASKEAMSSHAWKTLEELQDWLRTMRADVTQGFNCNIVAWTYKEKKIHVSPVEYEKIEAEEDVMLMNGHRRCKRIYDDENGIIYTYFVWYWDDPTKEFNEKSVYQNSVIKQYELHWRTPINQVAHKELTTGKVEPLNVSGLFKKWYKEEDENA